MVVLAQQGENKMKILEMSLALVGTLLCILLTVYIAKSFLLLIEDSSLTKYSEYTAKLFTDKRKHEFRLMRKINSFFLPKKKA